MGITVRRSPGVLNGRVALKRSPGVFDGRVALRNTREMVQNNGNVAVHAVLGESLRT